MPKNSWQLMDETTWTWFKVMATEFSRRLPSHFHVTRRAQGEATVTPETAWRSSSRASPSGAPAR